MSPLVIAKKTFHLSVKFNDDMTAKYSKTISVPVLNQSTRNWKITVKSTLITLLSGNQKIRLYLSGAAERPAIVETYDEKCFYKFRVLNKKSGLKSIRYKTGLIYESDDRNSFDFDEDLDIVVSPEGEILDRIRTLHFVLTLGTLNNEWRKFSPSHGPLSTISRMLENRILTDVVIKTTMYNFPCHKCVLAASSEFFEVIFTTDMKEKRTSIVDWRGIYGCDTVGVLLKYLYQGEDEKWLESTKDKYKELIDVAHLCQLDKLEEILETKMAEIIYNSSNLQDDGLVEFLVIADKYDLDSLREIAVEEFTRRFDKVKECEAWKGLKPDAQLKLFNVVVDVQRQALNVRETE